SGGRRDRAQPIHRERELPVAARQRDGDALFVDPLEGQREGAPLRRGEAVGAGLRYRVLPAHLDPLDREVPSPALARPRLAAVDRDSDLEAVRQRALRAVAGAAAGAPVGEARPREIVLDVAEAVVEIP